jgi:hypothetical protein
MHPRRRSAGHLQVDLGLLEPPDHLAADLLDLRQRLGQRHLDALDALFQPRQVLGQPERLAAIDADDFVHAVAELESTVFDGNAGLFKWKVFAV